MIKRAFQRLSAFAACGFLIAVLLGLTAGEALGQSSAWAFPTRNLFVGELQNFYSSGGAKQHMGGCYGLGYPGWDRYSCNFTGGAIWITNENFTDTTGTEQTRHIAQLGFRFNGVGEMFPQKLELVGRYERPVVTVDGAQSFMWPIQNDRVDSNMKGDGKVVTITNTHTGITLTRTIRAFSNEYHDNYHIVEYELTNTGEIDEGLAEVPDQTLEEVHLGFSDLNEINEQGMSMLGWGSGWGHHTMGDGLDDEDNPTSFLPRRVMYAWQGRDVEQDYNTVGGPAMTDNFPLVFEGDSVGRLTSDHFMGYAGLHADKSAGDPSDDPMKPDYTNYDVWTTANAPSDKLSSLIFETIDGGVADVTHFDKVVPPEAGPWEERFANVNVRPRLNDSGNGLMSGYGPYTLAPGETVRIVRVKAAAGLSDSAAMHIGREFKKLDNADNPFGDIEWDADGNGTIEADERMSKQHWVATSRDSLFQTLERAKAAFEADYQIPEPPQPPATFRVTSEPGYIQLRWSPPAGGPPHVGYQIYRTARRVEGAYQKVAGTNELGPNTTEFKDTNVQRGISYYYYIQAVGQVNEDDTGMTPTGVRLRSNRAYTQTYQAAIKKRAPGESLSEVRIVPNPYNLKSESEVRWPDRQDQLAFFDIPGQCTIKIFTEAGELIETIEHTDGSGDQLWNLTTSSNQLIVSGIYIAVIQDHDTGDHVVRKFVVIR